VKATVDKGLLLIGIQGDDCAYLWLADPQATWWKIVNEGLKPGEIKDATVSIQGLPAGDYHIQWWHTWEGKPIANEKATAMQQGLTLKVPALTRDIACKVTAAR
jgi:hypothetical protein